MVYLVQNVQDYNDDIRVTLMAFYHGIKIVEKVEEDYNIDFSFRACFGEDFTEVTVVEGYQIFEKGEDFGDKKAMSVRIAGDYSHRQSFKNLFKREIYKLMSEWSGEELPWGDLTGVRPTKIAMTCIKDGGSIEDAINNYRDEYLVSNRKAVLGARVAAKELELTRTYELERDYCLYVGIPFCPSKCLYCSFTSYPISVYRDKAEKYIEKLKEEISYVAATNKNKKLVAVYVGGGTPTAIDEKLLDDLLTHINREFKLGEYASEADNCFDHSKICEFTVEAGRPDSITKEKLQAMKRNGVTRISINPQTMNDSTLKTIGRAHSSEQIKEAFLLARDCGFDNINMDLIAGLPGENLDSMRHTLVEIEKLNPESITVHSLAIKRAANLKQQMEQFGETINKDMDGMLSLVSEYADKLSMEPYYLYRQKNIGGNLENVGYAKPGKECLYNILIMEELLTIIACGAGTVTKRVYPEGRIERCDNVKDVNIYLDKFQEMLERKRRLFAD